MYVSLDQTSTRNDCLSEDTIETRQHSRNTNDKRVSISAWLDGFWSSTNSDKTPQTNSTAFSTDLAHSISTCSLSSKVADSGVHAHDAVKLAANYILHQKYRMTDDTQIK
jgi:hypothetical protein